MPEAARPEASRAGRARHARHAPGRAIPLHPFLFAAASVLALMSTNLNQTSFPDVAPALIGVVGFALAIYLLAGLLRRRFDATAAVIASIWVVGCLYYEKLVTRLNDLLDGGFPMVAPLPLALAVMLLLTVLVARLRRPPMVVHTLLNGIALVFFAMPAWHALDYEWRHRDARAVYDGDRAAAELPQIAAAGATGADRPPDIYHFLFDRLASEDVLEQHFGIEPGIARFLEDRGFYVAEASHSNYIKTGHSLASTFYMDYLDLLSDPRIAGDNWHPVFEMLDDHRAARFLQARGYEFLQFGSWWVGTYDNAVADENHPFGFSEFNMHYFKRTILRPLFHVLPDTGFTMRLDWDYAQCQRVARQVEMIKGIGEREQPTYVFAHFLLPHDPNVFAADGRCLSQAEARERGRQQGYVDQVAYAHRVIEDLVIALQAEGRRPPVILIQADEGPFPPRDYLIPWQDAAPKDLQIKTGILNAYYFPGRNQDQLWPDISPVNSYRVLFNTYFGTDFPLLPDRIYAFPFDDNLFEFHDVTPTVRGETSAESRHAIPPPSAGATPD